MIATQSDAHASGAHCGKTGLINRGPWPHMSPFKQPLQSHPQKTVCDFGMLLAWLLLHGCLDPIAPGSSCLLVLCIMGKPCKKDVRKQSQAAIPPMLSMVQKGEGMTGGTFRQKQKHRILAGLRMLKAPAVTRPNHAYF